jgi:hypothetical protein
MQLPLPSRSTPLLGCDHAASSLKRLQQLQLLLHLLLLLLRPALLKSGCKRSSSKQFTPSPGP